MAKPEVQILSPSGIHPNGAFFHGQCISQGGLPTKLFFQWRTFPNYFYWKKGPDFDVAYNGQRFQWYCDQLSWRSNSFCRVGAYNTDGYAYSKDRMFWCSSPPREKLGAPWAIKAFGGSCYDHRYAFEAFTDIGCHLTAYVGRKKPYVSPTVHFTKGVEFHHDAILIFHYDHALDQEEAGDSITHSYDYEYKYYDHPYWLLFMGTVDGKESPSISAPYKFFCVSPPKMTIDDAYDITKDSAKLPGHLVDDKGLPVYCRFNYGIKPDYTANTPTLGPKRHPFDYVQQITDLDPETWYRFRAEGSHQETFPYHGISRPKDFLTLPAPIFKHCFADPENHIRTDTAEGYKFTNPLLPCENIIVSSARYHVAWTGEREKARLALFALYEADADYKPIGDPIAYAEQEISLGGAGEFIWIDFSFSAVNLIADHHYAWVQGAPYVDGAIGDFRIGYDGGLNGICNFDPGDYSYFSWWIAGEWYPWTSFGRFQHCYELKGPS